MNNRTEAKEQINSYAHTVVWLENQLEAQLKEYKRIPKGSPRALELKASIDLLVKKAEREANFGMILAKKVLELPED